MKITPVDSIHNLFLIEDFYTQDLIDSVGCYNCDLYAYQPILVEGQYTRRNIIQGQQHVTQMYAQSIQNTVQIGKFLNKDLKLQTYNVWYDLPGYFMGKHLDAVNHVKIGMQIYLTEADQSLGTYFYNNDEVRYYFPYIPNTGYMMINSPQQYHAAPTAVPNNMYRLSMYHRISIA